METVQVLKIETRIGIGLLGANCLRLALWWDHVPSTLAITSDVFAILGGLLYLRARHLMRRNPVG